MNKMKHHINPLIMLIMTPAVWLFSSCEQDDSVETLHATPLQLASQTGAPQTRATSDGTWTDGEMVRVNINGTPYDFTAANDETLTDVSQYWNDYARNAAPRFASAPIPP
jgi:hypothetical protein